MKAIVGLLLALTIFVVAVVTIVVVVMYKKSPKKQNDVSETLLGYLSVLYPASNALKQKTLQPNQVIQLYNSLNWYYFPLVAEIPKGKGNRAITGPYMDESVQWYTADGTDCGSFSNGPGTFVCTASGMNKPCAQSEFGTGGKSYQAASFIQPYARKWFPSYSYVEAVAYPCESMGKKLLAGNCEASKAPTWDAFKANAAPGTLPDATCGAVRETSHLVRSVGKRKQVAKSDCTHVYNECDTSVPDGCKAGMNGEDTCCYNAETQSGDDSVCGLSQCINEGKLYYCGYTCGYMCDDDCEWRMPKTTKSDACKDGVTWEQWLESVNPTKDTMWMLDFAKAVPCKGNAEVQKRPKSTVRKTLFFWMPGYGKFLSCGKTAVYFNYVHYLLTCPQTFTDPETKKELTLRMSIPQVFRMGYGGLNYQLDALTSGNYIDQRKYLEGWVTTPVGKDYEGDKHGKGVLAFDNTIKGTENVNGLLNPQDSPELKDIATNFVCRYYPPASKIANPQYGKVIQYSPSVAVRFMMAMYINGDIGVGTVEGAGENANVMSGSPKYPSKNWVNPKTPNAQSDYDTGTFPFGTFHTGLNLGSCVYETAWLSGLDSVQISQWPKPIAEGYCQYPAHDFEICRIGESEDVCNQFYLLDPCADFDTFTKKGYIQGSTNFGSDCRRLNLHPFNPKYMPLTERNPPSSDNDALPNAAYYPPSSKTKSYVPFTNYCPYKDDTYGCDPKGCSFDFY